jgi:putative FmdB family regulatory protein
MPIYEYACQECGKVVDVLQKLTDPAPAKCEACGAEGRMTKMVSRTSFVLKGGGWYSDLYSSTKKDAGGGGTKESTSSSAGTSSSTSATSSSAGAGGATSSSASAGSGSSSSGSSGSGTGSGEKK